MRIAIFGTLKPSTYYRDWARCFHRHFWRTPINAINITGRNTILNSYIKRYANALSIPVIEYSLDECSDPMQAKVTRNKKMIHDADMVVACVDDLKVVNCCTDGKKFAGHGKRAVVIDVSSRISQSKSIKNMHITETKNVSREELISVEEESALIRQIQQSPDDCEAAKEKLLLANRRFVRAIAQKYASENHSVEELIVEGNKGLLHAVKKYDESQGFKFISYASWWIKESLKQYINNF